MNSHRSLPAYAGWFGKIPSLGDFVTRRLPMSFVEPWDEWLSAELSEARIRLGDTWAASYAQAPSWCFSLGAGVVDDNAWHGILLPSFDRVGRQFPLTIALGGPRHAAATPERQWWAALLATGRRALEPSCGADGVDEALAVFLSDQLESERRAAADVQGTEPTLAALGEGTSAWWLASIEDPADALPSTFDGLPRGAGFQELLGAR